MSEEVASIPGSQKAAIFLLGLGEEGAAAVMKHMSPKEVQKVGEAMANLGDVSNQHISGVVEFFTEQVNSVSPISIGATDFTRRVMVQALGEDKAKNVLSQVMQSGETKGIEALKWMDPRSVAGIIRREHPQIIALVLSSLESDHASRVMAFLPSELQSDVLVRIARLDLIDPGMMQELDQVLEKQLGEAQRFSLSQVDGLNTAANILNNLDSATENLLMDAMKEVDAELSDKVTDLMFVFDNLMAVDDRGMQRLLREISVDSLVIALKGVDEKLQDKFFNNMSSRAAEMLKEDLDAKGPVKISEVEEAQKEILTVTKRLADEGEIFLGTGGADFV